MCDVCASLITLEHIKYLTSCATLRIYYHNKGFNERSSNIALMQQELYS